MPSILATAVEIWEEAAAARLILAGDDDLEAIAATRDGAGADDVAISGDRREIGQELLCLRGEVGAGLEVDEDGRRP